MIYLLWPTVRPKVFIQTHNYWLNICQNESRIVTKIAVNNPEQQALLDEYDVIITGEDRPGVCYPSYCLSSTLQAQDNDIVILASDDFFPPEHWDQYLLEQFESFQGCLMVRDGFQNPDPQKWVGPPALTIPIMTYGCLLKLNRLIYHPAYYHICSDLELYLNVEELGLLKDNRIKDHTTFEHRHWVVRKRTIDAADQRVRSLNNQDRHTFNLRKGLSLTERLTVQDWSN